MSFDSKKGVSEELALKIRPLSSIPFLLFLPVLLLFFFLFSFFAFSPFPPLYIYIYICIRIYFSFLFCISTESRTPAQHPISRRNENWATPGFEMVHDRPTMGYLSRGQGGSNRNNAGCRDQFPWMGFPFRLSWNRYYHPAWTRPSFSVNWE